MLTGFFFVAILLLPLLLIGAVIWLVLLPIRLLFHLPVGLVGGFFSLLFGLAGALLGIVLVPVVLLVVGVALVGAFFAAALALLTPLIPIVLLGLLGWGVYRLFVRPSPAV